MLPRPQTSTLFPYTTLFRSLGLKISVISASLICTGLRQPQKCNVETRLPRCYGSRRNSLIRSEEHTSELQSQFHLVCRLLLEKKKGQAGCTCAGDPRFWHLR